MPESSRKQPPEFGNWVWVPMGSEYLRRLQSHLKYPKGRNFSANFLNDFDKVEIADRIVRFQYEYSEDPAGDAWTPYPNGKGDCEDFALLWHRHLVALGADEEDVFIVIFRLSDDTGHAITTYKNYALDVMYSDVATIHGYKYQPLFAFNRYGSWVAGEKL